MTPQELKNSILQLAIQGKLVEQRPEEGTGEGLYRRLMPYHKGLKPCKDELGYSSMDFEIPASWTMIELNQLFDFVDYRGKTPNKTTSGVFLITASNIRQAYMDYTRKEYISREEYKCRQSRGLTQKGDLLFTTEAPMGNAALCDLDECSCGQRIITFKEYTTGTVCPALYMYFILSPQFQQQLLDNCTGTTAKGIKADKLKHFLIPLPPFAEQKRIVAKIEELLPLIDRYEKAWSKLEDFNRRFPVDMQKSVLQMAIQGKLVDQRPEEGTGEELLEKILATKNAKGAKKNLTRGRGARGEKATSALSASPREEISDDEKPFDIPESWVWVRLGDICSSIADGDHQPPPQQDHGVPFLVISNVSSGELDFSRTRFVGEEYFDSLSEERKPSEGDLLVTVTGSYGIVVPVETSRQFCFQRHMALLKTTGLFNRFLIYFLQAPVVKSYFDNVATGSAQKTVGLTALRNTLVPLPPLAEQKRIVAKLEEILPLCERLK